MPTKEDLLDTLPDDIPLREIRPVQSQHLVVSEAIRVSFHIRLQAGQCYEDCLVSDFYKLVGHRLMPSALIEIEPADSSWWALVLVREVSREHARVFPIMKIDLPNLYGPNIDELPLGHSVQFLGPQRLWAVLRGTQILHHGFTDKSSAIAWLKGSLS